MLYDFSIKISNSSRKNKIDILKEDIKWVDME